MPPAVSHGIMADYIEELEAEVRRWRPMTPSEADAELAAIEAGGVDPLSDDDVARMMAKINDPTWHPDEPTWVKMLHEIERLRAIEAQRRRETNPCRS
jgi:hypothetical protein